jgi:tetrahydromethanopterin S-methyltransferase subunit A
VGVENPNPLEELERLDQQVELVNDLEALKPIFYRIDEIAKRNPSDFDVQLMVGDVKQHLIQRGTRLKH